MIEIHRRIEKEKKDEKVKQRGKNKSLKRYVTFIFSFLVVIFPCPQCPYNGATRARLQRKTVADRAVWRDAMIRVIWASYADAAAANGREQQLGELTVLTQFVSVSFHCFVSGCCHHNRYLRKKRKNVIDPSSVRFYLFLIFMLFSSIPRYELYWEGRLYTCMQSASDPTHKGERKEGALHDDQTLSCIATPEGGKENAVLLSRSSSFLGPPLVILHILTLLSHHPGFFRSFFS